MQSVAYAADLTFTMFRWLLRFPLWNMANIVSVEYDIYTYADL